MSPSVPGQKGSLARLVTQPRLSDTLEASQEYVVIQKTLWLHLPAATVVVLGAIPITHRAERHRVVRWSRVADSPHGASHIAAFPDSVNALKRDAEVWGRKEQ